MLSAQLKCTCGQFLYPCNPQGRQSKFNAVSIIFDLVDNGPKPNAGIVEQKNAVIGAFIEDAICNGAESFTKFIVASFINAAV